VRSAQGAHASALLCPVTLDEVPGAQSTTCTPTTLAVPSKPLPGQYLPAGQASGVFRSPTAGIYQPASTAGGGGGGLGLGGGGGLGLGGGGGGLGLGGGGGLGLGGGGGLGLGGGGGLGLGGGGCGGSGGSGGDGGGGLNSRHAVELDAPVAPDVPMLLGHATHNVGWLAL
jgi:hypothetical protein